MADVDADRKQEIIYGAATIDHDGSLLYSSFDVMPPESADPGGFARLGHGDAMHVTDIDPNRPGLEIYMVHEGGRFAPYGHAMRDAATGDVLFGDFTGEDTGRGMVGDILPDRPGLEAWAASGVGLWSADGEFLGSSSPGTNQSVRWAADMTTQIIDGALEVTPTIEDWQRGTLLTAEGTRTNNGTKGNPGLAADVFGDWREEALFRTVDSSAIRIYLSTELTDRKLYTLMHDPQYRAEVARQQTTYNQPSYPSFYLASDLDWAQVPVPDYWTPGSVEAVADQLDRWEDLDEVAGWARWLLRFDLARADHHLARGDVDDAVRALDHFRDHLALPGVSATARTALTYQADTVISMLT